MNPLVIFPLVAVVWFTWILIVGLRNGELRYRTQGRFMSNVVTHLKRSESPRLFYAFAALQAAVILYILWIAVTVLRTPQS